MHASAGHRHPLARAWRIWLVLAVVALIAFVVALSIGSTSIAPLDVLHALLSQGDSTNVEVVRQLRLPRALAAFATGGLLAVAGALIDRKSVV